MFLLLTLSKQSWEGGSLAKGAVPKKNMALGNRFQKMRGSLTIRAGGGGVRWWGVAEFSQGQRGAKFSEETSTSRATMFFCKRVISVGTLLLIIHITVEILKWY